MLWTNRTIGAALVFFVGAVGALSLSIAGTRSAGGAEGTGAIGTPAFVETRYGEDVVAYATVRRSDGTYRRMLVSKWALESIAEDRAVPDGARILMETYYRPGVVSTIFHARKSGPSWRYGSFPAGSPDLATRSRASCLSCHAEAADTDLVFTLPSLLTFASGGRASEFVCERGGRSPCAGVIYREGATQ